MKQNKIASFLGHSEEAIINWLKDWQLNGTAEEVPGGRVFFIGEGPDHAMSFHFNPQGALFSVGVGHSDTPDMAPIYEELGLDWSIAEEEISEGNEPDFANQESRSYRLSGDGIEYLVSFENDKAVFISARFAS